MYLNYDGTFSPCCIAPDKKVASLSIDTFESAFKGEKLTKIREHFLKGLPMDFCSACVNTEKSGGKSLRLINNENFSIYWNQIKLNFDKLGKATRYQVFFIDLRYSNLCNLKCRTCGHSNSSTWFDDDKALSKRDNSKKTRILTPISEEKMNQHVLSHLDSLKELYVAGGEPFLSKGFFPLLEKLDNMKANLTVNTNLSYSKNRLERFISLTESFKSVNLILSLDDIDLRFEYLRKNSSFKRVKENLDYLSSLKRENVQITVNVVISIFNVYYLNDLKEFLTRQFVRPIHISWILLDTPFDYKISSMPYSLKIALKKHLVKNCSSVFLQEISFVLKALESPQDGEFSFFPITKAIDSLRDESFEEVFFEWFHFMKVHIGGAFEKNS